MSYRTVSPTEAETEMTDEKTDEGLCSKFFSCLAGDDSDDEDDDKREEEEKRLKKQEERKKQQEEFARKLQSMPQQQLLFYYAKRGNIEEIKKIPKAGIDINAKDEEGLPEAGVDEPYCTLNTALHFAVLSFSVECVELVWNLFQTPVDDRNKLESTPLHLAASLGCTDIVQWLIEKKADLELKNKIGNTALHCSVLANHIETTETILQSLDDPMQSLHEPNGVGMSPAKYAESDEMMDLLRKYLPTKSQPNDNFNSNNGYGNDIDEEEEEPAND